MSKLQIFQFCQYIYIKFDRTIKGIYRGIKKGLNLTYINLKVSFYSTKYTLNYTFSLLQYFILLSFNIQNIFILDHIIVNV